MGRREKKVQIEECKKRGFYPVRIPVNLVSVYPVSLPITSFPVTIPLKVFKEAPVSSISNLRSKVALTRPLPSGNGLS